MKYIYKGRKEYVTYDFLIFYYDCYGKLTSEKIFSKEQITRLFSRFTVSGCFKRRNLEDKEWIEFHTSYNTLTHNFTPNKVMVKDEILEIEDIIQCDNTDLIIHCNKRIEEIVKNDMEEFKSFVEEFVNLYEIQREKREELFKTQQDELSNKNKKWYRFWK